MSHSLDELKPTYEINSETGKRLGDLAAISQDLGRTLAFLRRLMAENDTMMQDALFTAALISYRRCFNSGKRFRLEEKHVSSLREQASKIHDYYISMANKFAAHSVNPFEQIQIGAIIIDSNIRGGGAFTMRLITFDNEGLKHWEHLIVLLKNKISEIARTTEADFLAEIMKLPVSEITKAKRLELHGPSDPTKTR